MQPEPVDEFVSDKCKKRQFTGGSGFTKRFGISDADLRQEEIQASSKEITKDGATPESLSKVNYSDS